MDNDKPCQATPHGTLLEQIMDSNLPKSEREWAAAREIATLRKENEQIRERLSILIALVASRTKSDDIILLREIDACKQALNREG